MAQRPAEIDLKSLPVPAKGNRVHFIDKAAPGFGVRVTSAGAYAFVLDFRTVEGRQRRLTIGSAGRWDSGVWRKGAWTVSAARDQARTLRREVDSGGDPMAERHEVRSAPTVNDLADRFEAEHLPKKRPATRDSYGRIIRLYIRPEVGRLKVGDVTHADVEKLHRDVSVRSEYQANRSMSVLSKMLSLAIRWGMRADNPVRGVERASEERRERFLSPAEVEKLVEALAAHPERVSADAILLLLLTGARRSEALSATWSQFDLATGVWVKPASTTKQAKLHRVPMSEPAVALLATIRERTDQACPYVFPGDLVKCEGGKYAYRHITEVRKTWASVCRAAGLEGVRLHDLRHSFASILASAGLSLPIIGALLGHSQAATTNRYSHLMDDALRAATEKVGTMVTGASKRAVTP